MPSFGTEKFFLFLVLKVEGNTSGLRHVVPQIHKD